MICSLILITECVQKAVERRIRSKKNTEETSASSNRSECENNEQDIVSLPRNMEDQIQNSKVRTGLPESSQKGRNLDSHIFLVNPS